VLALVDAGATTEPIIAGPAASGAVDVPREPLAVLAALPEWSNT
jgi:hypothetical protein